MVRAMMSDMTTRLRISRLVLGISSLLAVACTTAKQAERPASAPDSKRAAAPATMPVAGLYPADEAVRDALSGPWQYVGTGQWPGIRRMYACAFRNERVLIVNVYCGIKETPAFRVDVYSPTRGRVRIYAEAKGPLSAHMRQQYFTFTELRDYEEQRYGAYLPTCYGGKELERAIGGCLGPLASSSNDWEVRNRGFLERANSDWYRLVQEMRVLATQHGRDPE
jgi:hypothetical protein